MAAQERNAPNLPLSPRQIAFLLRLIHRFRRQMSAKVTELSLEEAEAVAQEDPDALALGPKPRRSRKRALPAVVVPPDQPGLPL